MTKAPAVIKFRGDRSEAYLESEGRNIRKSNELMTKEGMRPVLNTGNHIIYGTRQLGARHRCSCGMPAVLVGRGVYKKYTSANLGNEVFICQGIANSGRHGDGSSG